MSSSQDFWASLRTAQSVFLPGRPVHLNTISTSLGSIQPHCNFCTKFMHTTSTTVFIYAVEWPGAVSQFDMAAHKLNPGSFVCERGTACCTTALHGINFVLSTISCICPSVSVVIFSLPPPSDNYKLFQTVAI